MRVAVAVQVKIPVEQVAQVAAGQAQRGQLRAHLELLTQAAAAVAREIIAIVVELHQVPAALA
jgi:hypothetical protein